MSNQRIVLKISGEYLGHIENLNKPLLQQIAETIHVLQTKNHVQCILILGGGNVIRGRDSKQLELSRITSDHMGILATLINALCVRDIFYQLGLQTTILSSISIPSMFSLYNVHTAEDLLNKNTCLLIGGGIGLPYFSTDMVASLIAAELNANVVLKGTSVDGVYSADPKQYADVTFYPTISYDQAIGNSQITVMDDAALVLCRDEKVPVTIFSLRDFNINNFKNGKFIGKGTRIHGLQKDRCDVNSRM